MLGRFLELALVTDNPGSSWSALQRLGFIEASCGDIWTHPYGVVACEGLAIGLHARGEEPGIVFVRPDVAALERELSARLIEIETARLGSDVFNELELREPGGMLLRVIEARTFSPPSAIGDSTLLGRFQAISLPCTDLADALGFWERLGIDVTTREEPWNQLAVQGLPLGYHERGWFKEPALLFESDALPDEDLLRSAGAMPARNLPALHAREHRVLRTADGLAIIVLAAGAPPPRA